MRPKPQTRPDPAQSIHSPSKNNTSPPQKNENAPHKRGAFSRLLGRHPDGREKLDTAADQFLGFYLVNARTRQEYCLSLGVAIPTFVSEFDKIN